MDTNINLQTTRNEVLENVDLSQLQGEMNKLNPGVLRGIDGGTYHFITIPRGGGGDQEYLDHSLLSPDYMAAQIQNGLVVDIIQTQPSEQHDSLDSHDIYANDVDRHYTMQHHQHESNSIIVNQNSISSSGNSTLHRNDSMNDTTANYTEDTNDGVGTVIMSEQDRRMTAAFMHYVQKQSPHLLTNEAPVIVSTTKELNSMASPLNDIDIENNFVTSMTHMDQSSLSCMPSEKCINLSNNQTPSKSHHQSNSLPPLPPLTPISKLQMTRRTRDLPSQQQIIQYKHVAEDRRMNAQVDMIDAKYVEIHGEDVGSSKIVRQMSNESTNAQAPRKSLPHKKRITKKLKSISPNEEQIQMQLQQAHYQTQLHPYHHQQQQQQQQHHTAVINLTPEQNSLQSPHSSQIISHAPSTTVTANEQQMLCNNQLHAQNMSMGMSSSVITQHHSTPFSCELCGLQSDGQLEFFTHLKLHYEPSHQSMKATNEKPEAEDNGLDLSSIDLPTAISTFSVLQRNSQNMYEMEVPSTSEHFASSADATMCTVNECRNDEDSIGGAYNVQSHHHVKSEQNNRFSDTEDMLESGVIEKVQRTVDNYIKNSAAAEKESTEKDWFQQHEASDLSNHIVYQMTKTNMADEECGLDATEYHMNRQRNGNNTVIERIPATATSEELTLIYEINGKDLTEHYSLIDESTSDAILRNQLIKAEEANGNECEYAEIDGGDSNGINYVIEKGKIPTEADSNSLTMRNIFDEFIEQEKTDSDCEATATKANGTRKKKKIYRCKRCDKLCYSKNALHYHFLSHTGERPFVCEICGKSFFASSALKVHKRLHSGDKPYECSFCSRPFRQWGDLKYHIQSRHTTEKNHQCEFCGKDFARRYSLVIHRRIHTGEKNYKCEYCDKQFRASSYLQVHRKIHTGEKPYNCDICGKKFRVRGDLKRHSNIHERGKSKEMKITESLEGATSSNSMAENSLNSIDHVGVILNATAADIPKETGKKTKKRNPPKANNSNKTPKLTSAKSNFVQMAIDSDMVINYSTS